MEETPRLPYQELIDGSAPVRRRTLVAAFVVTITAAPGLLAACGVPGAGQLAGAIARRSAPTPAATAASLSSGTATPAGTAAPTSTTAAGAAQALPDARSPQIVAGLFLGYWNAAKYDAMYTLLSRNARAAISASKFAARYQAISHEATITALKATLIPGQAESATVQNFELTMNTALVGTITQQNAVPLIQDPEGWRVQWLPSLIFKDLTGDNLIHMFPLSQPRGGITDRSGAPLAEEGPAVSVDIVPKQATDLAKTVQAVAATLGVPVAFVQAAVNKVNGHPDWRAPVKTLPPDQLAPIQAKLKAIPGVLLTEVQLRTYPRGRLASNVIGYMSQISSQELQTAWKQGYLEGDIVGRTGIERWGEPLLAGKRGGKLAVVTPQGDVWTVIAERAAEPGKNIQLTIDTALQATAEAALGKFVGSAVAMRVSDGSILAAASNPGFDPNSFILGLTPQEASSLFNNPGHPFQDRVTTGLYPTGSIFKTITMATVLQANIFNPSSMFFCPGYWTGLGIRMNCWKTSGHGHIDLMQGLAQSCDVVFYICGHESDLRSHTLLPTTAKEFGLAAPTGILGLREGVGDVPSPAWKEKTLHQPWYPGDPVNLAVGQGLLLATPLQAVNWIAAIANGGTLWVPRVIDRVITPGGGSMDPNPPKPRGKLPTSPQNLAAIREGMRQAIVNTTNWDGTGSWEFRDFPIPVAGKTGTAQSGQPKPHGWFASFAPADKPEIAIIAMVEHADAEGAYICAPIVRKMYETYFKVNWQSHVTKPHQLCNPYDYLCPWMPPGGRKIQYGG